MSTRSLRADYLSGAEPLRPFYQYPLQNPDFGAVVARKAQDAIDRSLLQQVIREQYAGLTLPPALEANLDALAEPSTYTVTTGHQLVLFGGPLFTTYKILSTIRLAEQISREQTGVRVVPVFWIHTEDHDFEEINHYFTAYNRRHTYGGTFVTQVGTHVLEACIKEVCPQGLPEALQEAYRPGRTMAEAFRDFMHRLFGEYGLVILDASDARLKARFGEVVQAELAAPVTEQAVNDTSAALAAAGYSLQISPREINLFYLDEKGRDRLRRQGDGFGVVGRDLHWSP
ncbi:MAG: bacillithiol biosynthesis BshC, partial [Bacteroidetes bacterium]